MNKSRDPGSTVVALIVSTSTFIKTVLYFFLVFLGDQSVVPSTICVRNFSEATYQQCIDWLWFVIPNGTWIVIPALVIYSTASQLARANALAPAKKF